MNKVLLDTNIILDIALNRQPYIKNSNLVIRKLLVRKSSIYITATTVTDIYYILRKTIGHQKALDFIKSLFTFLKILAIDAQIVMSALNSRLKDFEDAIQVEAAKMNNVDVIITRNKKDFINSDIEVFTPEEFLAN